jgi:glutathione S-transferase
MSSTSKPKLIYFDAPMSRGEECRLALHVAGVAFEDVRIKREEWAALKPSTPFGSLPVLEMPGHLPLAQSNAILVFIGRHYGIHPQDEFQAARHEAVMCHVEDLRAAISPSMRMTDEAEKRKAREELARSVIPVWAAQTEKQIGHGAFFAGTKMHVVDLKLHMIVRWLTGGALDHVPGAILDAFPKLRGVHDAVRDDAHVKEWRARAT